ncbi:DUF1062 domain-containing protein [Chryseobacterium arthrosphaerae]|uniref:DUF1062 domain-containing protein n=1 Tax=Chryseobacterium arthrosphaerae TaxID=651561 RepID=UPI001BAEA2A5|nr:DUF1062 domain-containing protein [Chryseobacterium arthrosphaerae]QUY57083.1 DUF1062 domain-containing protein [Chryseobacterium arthrosphaerae]
MSIQHIWEIRVKNTPLLKKKCSHCDSDRFACSDKFRLNAQKKNIDIWLIYRCVKCSNTYNMTLFSRIRTESVSKEIFNKMSENNTEMAWEYAFSHDIRRKNNVEADPDSVEYEIRHNEIQEEEMMNPDSEMLTFKIKCPFDCNLRMSAVIREGLNLSSAQLKRLIETDGIWLDGKPLQKKHKIKNEDTVQVHKAKLKSVLYKDEAIDVE